MTPDDRGLTGASITESRQGEPAVSEVFRRFAHGASWVAGTPWAFLVALLIIVLWALLGPVFGFSDTWQLVINTGTTIVTFLMVFLIQNTQNRDARAMQLKLDELIRAMRGARNTLIDIEDMSDEELERIHQEFSHHLQKRRSRR
jgi:low affinity Fe/Cu permease